MSKLRAYGNADDASGRLRRLYICVACGARLTPKQGDCCVFCSYGDVPSPPVRAEGKCCSK
jgi:ribosomal protein L40E